MRVFVNNVDAPLGEAVSRLLTETVIGSRKMEDPEEEEEENEEEKGSKQQQYYEIVGTFSTTVFPSQGLTTPGIVQTEKKEGQGRKDT